MKHWTCQTGCLGYLRSFLPCSRPFAVAWTRRRETRFALFPPNLLHPPTRTHAHSLHPWRRSTFFSQTVNAKTQSCTGSERITPTGRDRRQDLPEILAEQDLSWHDFARYFELDKAAAEQAQKEAAAVRIQVRQHLQPCCTQSLVRPAASLHKPRRLPHLSCDASSTTLPAVFRPTPHSPAPLRRRWAARSWKRRRSRRSKRCARNWTRLQTTGCWGTL